MMVWLKGLRLVFEKNMKGQAKNAHYVLWAVVAAFEIFWAGVTARSQLGFEELQKTKSTNHIVAGYSVSACPADCKDCKVRKKSQQYVQ